MKIIVRSKNKSGMTLVEMLVAIAIFGIGMQGATMLFLKSWQANSFIIEEGRSTMVVSRAMGEVVKNLRKIQQSDSGEFPIKAGGDFSLTVFLDIDNDQVVEKVHYFLENQALKRGISEPAGEPPIYPESDDNVEVLTNYIMNEPDQPLFYYYNKNYPGDFENNPLSTPIAVADPRLIKIHLLINVDPIRAPNNVNLESFVQLRNINDYLQ